MNFEQEKKSEILIKRHKESAMKFLRGKIKYIGMIGGILIVTACSNNKPRPINIGQDVCAYCKMGITDTRFASELITAKGKVYKFDSIECLASYYLEQDKNEMHNATLWVPDFNQPKEWISGKNAVYLKSDKIRSPMGLGLLAFRNEAGIQKVQDQTDGNKLTWKEMLTYVRNNKK